MSIEQILSEIEARAAKAQRCFESDPAYKILRTDIPRLVAALRVAVEDIQSQLPDCEKYGWLSKQARLTDLLGRIEAALKGDDHAA